MSGRGGEGIKRTILVPFVAMIVVSVGLGWVSYYVGSRQAVLDTVDLLAREEAARVQDRLDAYLGQAASVAEADADFVRGFAARDAADGGHDLASLSSAFRFQLLGVRSIDLVCAGFSDGEYAEAQRLSDGRVRIGKAGASTGGALVLERTDESGAPVSVDLRKPGYDPRTRPWFQKAAEAGRMAWSEPYALVSTGELAISAAVPVYSDGRLHAVVTADLRLGALSLFLSEAAGRHGSLAYVIDPRGQVVASSRAGSEPPGAANFAQASSGAVGKPCRARVEGVWYRCIVLPFNAGGHLDWRVLVCLPEAAFLAPLRLIDLRAGAVLAAALVLAILLALLAADRIATPLRRLRESVARLDPEDPGASLAEVLALAERRDEIGDLAQGFHELSRRLSESFASLRSSLGEKEVLLREVHHRVKNNLQIVSSLLSLQADSTSDPEARSSLEELQDRVQAMAFVHEDMYGSGDFSSIRMDAYIQRVCDSLTVSPRRDCVVSTRIEPSELRLPLEKALICGLVVNELVTNALKYAFVGRRSGELLIEFAKEAGECRVSVSDDGVGLGAGGAVREGGIGAMLLEGLASQLKGRIATEAGCAGLRVTLSFPLE